MKLCHCYVKLVASLLLFMLPGNTLKYTVSATTGGDLFLYFGVKRISASISLTISLSEQLAHSAVDLHLEEISEFLQGSEMNRLQSCCSKVTPQSAA